MAGRQVKSHALVSAVLALDAGPAITVAGWVAARGGSGKRNLFLSDSRHQDPTASCRLLAWPGGVTGVAWYFGINLMNLDNITLTNVVVVNAPRPYLRASFKALSLNLFCYH